jgi:amino acid adenylation domain-containing protein/non-ribosomal peptide synthase protein (TIGR01720 family)
MTDLELIRHLSSLGVRLWVEGEALRFSAPKGVLTDDLKEQLRARKEAIRDFLRRASRRDEPGEPAAIPRAPRDGALPVSFGQERLWFLEQLEPGSLTYTLPSAIRLGGPLDEDALRGALAEIVRRHEILRTTLDVSDGRPVQVIHPPAPVDLTLDDLCAMPAEEREHALAQRLAVEVRRPFSLAQGPLFRVRLYRLGAEDHVLAAAFHHVVFDGWSQGIFARELGALYDAFTRGEPSPLPELAVQYADFAAWQRRLLSGEALLRQLSFWKKQLAGAPGSVELPLDRPRPPTQSYRGAMRSFAVAPDVSAKLRELAQREGVTTFMLLLAAFHALLHRYTGQDDLVVGSPIAGRGRPETEPLLGFFVNTLALRARVDPAAPFLALLGQAKETCLGAYAHQDIPFERLVQEIAPERDPSRSPVFQILFALQNAPRQATSLAGTRRRGLAVDTGTAKFDLNLAMIEGPSGLHGTFEFATDLFDAATIERMGACFTTLLGGIAADPGQPVGALPLLPEPERRLVVETWNDTAHVYPEHRAIHEIFAAQAATTPDAVALGYEGEEVSYGELDGRANQLANALRRRGVGPDTLVGVFMERSVELVVALYGVLKAGGAYVPLDPEYPRDRLAFMLEDGQPRIILTQARLAGVLPEHRAELIALDADWPSISGESAEAPARDGLTLATLAYVIYTSGSTGRPKGAMNEHRGIQNRLLWMQHAYGLTGGDRVLQKTPFSFDVSVWELFWPLMFGARLVVARPGGHREPSYLSEVIAGQGITTLHFVPSMLAAFLDEIELRGPAGRARCASLRRVVCSGEALPAALSNRLFAVLGPEVELHNLYGPTEAAVDVTWQAVRPGATVVPIGKPIHNVRIYLLDDRLAPVPAGVRGELYIAGVQVGRGYLNRAELTAERFVRDPFAGDASARLYKTGDVARWLPDGAIEYLGRADFQVKIRGFRIELGEIEAVLGQFPGVRDAVVLAREDVPGDKRLCAYLVTRGPAPATAELRAFARERLPEYMVPAAFVALDALPLGASGKVDRRALPAPDGNVVGERIYVAPRGPVEETIASVFADILQIAPERVGAHDSFFDLGGHSLLATRVVARLRAALGVELPLRALFEAPSAADLAERATAALGVGVAAPPLVALPPGTAQVLSFAQERLWFIDQLAPGDASYLVPLAIRLSGPLDPAALEAALREIVRRHEVLRTHYVAADGKPAPVVRPEPDLALAVTGLSHWPEADREAAARREIAADARRTFDLSTGPVLRARLLELGEREHVLVVVMHHIVSDAWSIGVLTREIGALYEAFAAGHPSPLPELPIQYADYAAWQRGWLAGAIEERQLAYWKERLAGAPRALDLPTDRPRPPSPSHRGARVGLAVPEAVAAGLRRLSRQQGATLYMTLLAAFDVLLHRYTGQTDLVVGTPIAGRTRAETEGLIGFFINSLALRTELAPDMPFTAVLARVKETCLGAYAHQDMPFERLVQEIEPERDLSRTPLFQVVFVLQNAPPAALAMSGLRRRSIGAESGTAKFDLTITLAETPAGISGGIEFATDLFDAATVTRLGAHFAELCASVAAAPELPVRELSILPVEERRRVVVDWNDTRTSYPRDATIHALFRAQVARTPEAIALTFGAEAVSYAELRRRSSRLAHRLRERGVGAETPVGLYARRSVELVVALIAILEAGGFYVPLDPEVPDARLAFIVADAALGLVVAAGTSAAGRPLGEAAVLDLTAEAASLAAASEAELPPLGGAESLAYVMYTSGSTGMPKGVCVPHRGVVRLVKGTGFAPFDAGEVLLQLAPIAFDASTLEIWGALLNGGRLVVSPPEPPSPAQLGEIVRASGVTTLWLTAGLFNAVVDAQPDALATLRRVLTGGEALSVPHVQRALAALPGVQLINGYGPTENTTFTTTHPISAADAAGAIPIGRPIANTTVYVLDPHRQPVPIGVPGELYTGGDGVARGYLRRPELSEERFVPDPFSDRPGARMYRTGDLVRWLPDGTVAFLGRLDFQVKLRGFRIELGEIEIVLAQHPSVTEAVVLLREDAPGDKRLVGYVAAGTKPAPAELRAFLEERLPAYMVPAAFVALDALPLTPNGKVDRRALPPPEASALITEAYVAPRGPIEETLASIFADVLRVPVEQVGAHDGFFALGGHSLLATQAVTRIRAALGVELPLRVLFESDTPAELARHVDAAMRADGGVLAPPLARVPRGGALPLSFAQERLWFLHQLDPADASYAVPFPMRFEGVLDVPALGRALAEVVRRHEVLRTSFPLEGGAPVAAIHEAMSAELALVPLAGEGAPEEALARAVAAETRRPFDLATGPVLRATLFALAADDHVLLVVMHHIASDGWSIGVLSRELSALYAAFSSARPSPLAELPIQYADYAAWQRGYLSGDVLAAQLAYWQQRLAGATRILELPADRPRPPAPSHRGARCAFSLDAASTATLRDLARREGVTLFMLLLAAFDVLLYRWSGQTDILVGTPIAGRTRGEMEGLIGFFVNTLVMRAELADDLTFRDLLRRVREDALGAYAHQDMPFERLVQEIEPERDLSRTPIFQVMFVLQTAPMGGLELTGLKRRGVDVQSTTAKFDLTFTLVDRQSGLSGGMELACDLFDPETVDRLLVSYRTLLVGLAGGVERCLWELPVLPAAEERRLVELAGGRRTFPVNACLHELFEAAVDAWPEAIAATCEGESLTYGALERRANQVAHALRRRGVGPDVLVGLCVDRSLDMLVGLLGILKAGGAYLPLDPEYPRDRLAFMVEDARVAVVLTQARHAGIAAPGAEVLCLDAGWEAFAGEPTTPVALNVRPENLAYVIYTSGSTGKPKGAMVEHRQVVRLFSATAGWFGFGEGDVWTMFHSYAFDFSVWEIWGALLHGGRLVIVPYWVSRSPEAFYALLGAEGVTVLNQTPSAFRQLLRAEEAAGAEAAAGLALRYVIFGGEALDVADLRPFWDRHGDARPQLVNMYGITETTVHVTYRPVSRADLARPWSSVIGEPIPDLSVHVLDAHCRPTPLGVPGEMYVGGAGVARGYLRRPELTMDRFLADPFQPGGRLYKTGDLARRLASGDIEYLGRIDHQVKIRGFRIELGEIEAALDQHPDVREAVVLAREDAPGDKRLVAYLVTGSAAPALGALRAFLKERLPDYMVPAAFVFLSALPLTSNGKIDRRALPAPEAAGSSEREFVEPRGPVEQAIAAIFAEVLRAPRVGARDGFFELGGHSLLAAQAVARVRAAFGVELSLRVIFETSTPADLAARVEAALRAEPEGAVPPIPRASRAVPIEASFGQERLWILDRLDPGDPSYVVPLAYRFTGPVDAAALERSLREIVGRHEVLRTSFASVDGRPVQIIHPEVALRLPVEDLRALPDRDAIARRVTAEEAARPFDLAAAPLLRARLLVLADDAHVLLVAVHHIACDAWSSGVILRELTALYEAFAAGHASPLAELPIQYADYAAWQRGWFAGAVEARQLSYWRGQLEGAPPALDLPTDRPRPVVLSHRGAERAFALPAALAAALRDLSRREGTTLFMTLLAGFQLLLHRHAGQDDVLVGSPIANRSHPETEPLIGFFINTLVLRASFPAGLTFRALLRQVRETCLGAYAHQDMPFERLVHELAPERALGRTPLFQASFTLHAAPPERAAASDGAASGGAAVAPRAGVAPATTAKFDLTLGMADRSDGTLGGSIEYATDLFDAATIDRLIAHLGLLLEGAAQEPDRPVAQLSLLGEAERHQLLVAWNDTAAPFPEEARLHQLVEAQVDRTPEAVAVVFEDRSLTYAALDAAANRLAHRLQRLGVGPDALVGVCLERSIELCVALLAVLKAGGAYVPIDPSYPEDRIHYMLTDARAPVLLTQASLTPSLPRGDAAVIEVDTADLSAESAARPACAAGPEDLAYVIYTSGSTGRPKGVMIPHRAIVNHMDWMATAFPLGARHAVLQKTPVSFDASVWEFWAPLQGGARLVMARPEGHRETAYLIEAVQRYQVTELQLVPSMLELLVADPGLSGCTSLERLYAGGEALSRSLVDRCKARLPVDVVNLYGPTECTVQTVVWVAEAEARGAMEPIGRPIHNTRLYILDAALAPVPVGVAGELYIGGASVGRGYLGRPDLTDERYLPDPFAGGAARLYRTGDRARYRADGVVEYLGRLDHQVKLRGFRIELGEIEAVLRQHPAIAEVVVILREDGDLKRLVAYVTAGQGSAAPAVADLRAFAAASLPAYMVPAAYVVLDALPLTPGGKLDRRALPVPDDAARVQAAGSPVAPRTAVETELARIWGALLRLEHVGVHDNFFELGGDSIVGIQMTARAAEVGIHITPRQIFLQPTIAGLAAEAGAGVTLDAEQGPVTGDVLAGPIQRWWLGQGVADPHQWNQALFFEVRERLDGGALEDAVAALLDHHDALRLRLAADPAGPRLFLAPPGGPAPVWRFDLEGVLPAERKPTLEQTAADAQGSLDLLAGPIVRVVWFDLGPDAPGRLLLVIHHLAVDGVSWRVILEDLWTAYRQRVRGEPIRLSAKTTSFRRWTELLAAYAASAALDPERAHWLSPARARAGRLPVDVKGGENTEASARSLTLSLDAEETESLLRRVPEVYRTQINDVLLTALAEALREWTGSPVSLVDLEGHGREELFPEASLTRTVGWFTSLFPVVLELAAEAGPGESLKAVKEQLRAVPGRGLGYGLLRFLRADPEVAALPPAEIVFNYLGQFDQPAATAGGGPAGERDAPALSPARESSGPSHSPRARRAALLELNASVSGGRFHAQWTYSEAVHRRRTIEALAASYQDALRRLITHCLSPGAGGATPSDFDQASLSQDAIDMLAALDPNAQASSE